MKKIIQEIEQKKNAILFIDEIHIIIGTGATSNGSLDASNLLKPALSCDHVRCIGSTTFKEYNNTFEKDKALIRRFQRIDIDEASTDDTIKILKGIKSYYEEYHKIRYTNKALISSVHLSQRYINNKSLPDKAIDVIDEAGAKCKIQGKHQYVTEKDIAEVVARIAKIECAKTIKQRSLQTTITSTRT